MTKHFLVTVELPDWAAKEDRMELVREEIEKHAVACVGFYTRATKATAKCAAVEPSSVNVGVYCTKP